MMKDKDIKLSTNDKAIIESCKTGEGLIPVTSDMLKDMKESMDARQADIDVRYPELVKNCDYETRLAITSMVFDAIVQHGKEGGTFRYLIYDRLGFKPDAYYPLYVAGGMDISNEFDLTKTSEDKK